ncbi:MAG: VTT domain-containing protein [Clostridiaceae bacterium]|jgi:uncharacterized membrane protein YdjX (TVP38/TMEM64 family)|nr:VTT domain-containing protein [Clostridiaceae bacterium]
MQDRDDFMKDMDRMYKKLKRMRRRLTKRKLVGLIPLLVIFLLAAVFIHTLGMRFDSASFAEFNESCITTIIITLGFFTFKALTLFVISPVLIYGLVGLLFHRPVAMVVLVAGLLLELSINYIMGKFLGRVYVERLVLRIDDEGRLLEKLKNMHNSRMNIFLIRFIGVPPIGITSVYLSAMGLEFRKYMIYSMAGLLPKAVLVTLAGSAIKTPGSPLFVVSVVCLLVLGFIFYIYGKKKK